MNGILFTQISQRSGDKSQIGQKTPNDEGNTKTKTKPNQRKQKPKPTYQREWAVYGVNGDVALSRIYVTPG